MWRWLAVVGFTFWCAAASSNWVPGMIATKTAAKTYLIQGISSGIGYSMTELSHCSYVWYVKNNRPFPDTLKGSTCGIQMNPGWFNNGTWNYDIFTTPGRVNITAPQKTLYDRKAITIGEMLRVANESGQLNDSVMITYGAAFTNQPVCFDWRMYYSEGLQENSAGPKDNTCYRGQIVHPACDIREQLTIDHGLISSDRLRSGTATASVTANLYCESPSSVVIRTNSLDDLKLEPINGQGKLISQLYANGQPLNTRNGSNGVTLAAKEGYTPITLRSDLSGDENTLGDFMGSTVLVITLP